MEVAGTTDTPVAVFGNSPPAGKCLPLAALTPGDIEIYLVEVGTVGAYLERSVRIWSLGYDGSFSLLTSTTWTPSAGHTTYADFFAWVTNLAVMEVGDWEYKPLVATINLTAATWTAASLQQLKADIEAEIFDL